MDRLLSQTSRLPLATRNSRQSSQSHRLLSINIHPPPPKPQTPSPICQAQCMFAAAPVTWTDGNILSYFGITVWADFSCRRFTTAPPPAVMAHLIDAYFLHVHNQPYSYFHEQSFRDRVNYGLIPKCLLFAILASALKFSDSEYFQGSTREATEAYAREAWLAILHEHLTVENNPTLPVAQASNILGVVDFTCKPYFDKAEGSLDLVNFIPLYRWSYKFRVVKDWPCCPHCARSAAHEGAEKHTVTN